MSVFNGWIPEKFGMGSLFVWGCLEVLVVIPGFWFCGKY